MKIEILLFGRLTDLTGHTRLQLSDLHDTDALKTYLENQYVLLGQVNYQVAVDQVIIHGNRPLTDGMTVALMPPFSGG